MKYNLALCEIHYTPIHGKTNASCPIIERHFLLIATFKPHLYIMESESESESESDERHEIRFMKSIIQLYRRQYEYMTRRPVLLHDNPHTTIRNYESIISRKDYLKPEIVQCIVLVTSETIVIKKTFWLKLIQRSWKKIFKLRLKFLMSLQFIMDYQININYSKTIPGIRGMLYYLHK